MCLIENPVIVKSDPSLSGHHAVYDVLDFCFKCSKPESSNIDSIHGTLFRFRMVLAFGRAECRI